MVKLYRIVKQKSSAIFPLTFQKSIVTRLGVGRTVSLPVKHNWREDADLKLIERSTREIAALANLKGWSSIIIPRPGCGNGRLKWADVRPVLQKYLDDRFSVITGNDLISSLRHVILRIR